MKIVLSIAGSDNSAGAGIQADLKTFAALDVYGLSVVTSVTSQNSLGVSQADTLSAKTVEKQLNTILDDIHIDAIKIGMVCNKTIINILINSLKKIKNIPVILDTVMISSSGYRLLDDEAMELFINGLIPLSTLITPNIYEASQLSKMQILSVSDMKKAIKSIKAPNILLKGGHLKGDATDILFYRDKFIQFTNKKEILEEIHGTGCTLSSAIAAFLAKGKTMQESVKLAKEYIFGAIKHSFKIGEGARYLNHFYKVEKCLE